uniref:4'-phosphopantetheinyl transferase n=1 Tax=Rathayibacter iranicus TaxID=59737 RepID=A0A5J6SIV7_9MICO|nr:4'-phosphopantetheinyl transferase [Rathayibacter iranicus]
MTGDRARVATGAPLVSVYFSVRRVSLRPGACDDRERVMISAGKSRDHQSQSAVELQKSLLREIEASASSRSGISQLRVSRSHVPGLVAVAASSAGVGIDIERIKGHGTSFVRRFLAEREFDDYERSGHSHAFVTRRWTQKEALFKASGRRSIWPHREWEVCDSPVCWPRPVESSSIFVGRLVGCDSLSVLSMRLRPSTLVSCAVRGEGRGVSWEFLPGESLPAH